MCIQNIDVSAAGVRYPRRRCKDLHALCNMTDVCKYAACTCYRYTKMLLTRAVMVISMCCELLVSISSRALLPRALLWCKGHIMDSAREVCVYICQRRIVCMLYHCYPLALWWLHQQLTVHRCVCGDVNGADASDSCCAVRIMLYIC